MDPIAGEVIKYAMFEWGNGVRAFANNGYVALNPLPDDPSVDANLARREGRSRALTAEFLRLVRQDLGVTDEADFFRLNPDAS